MLDYDMIEGELKIMLNAFQNESSNGLFKDINELRLLIALLEIRDAINDMRAELVLIMDEKNE